MLTDWSTRIVLIEELFLTVAEMLCMVYNDQPDKARALQWSHSTDSSGSIT